jgi:hypothetical protein
MSGKGGLRLKSRLRRPPKDGIMSTFQRAQLTKKFKDIKRQYPLAST